jgi:hypothetical protein
VMASGAAITRTDDTEQRRWQSYGSVMLRGRAEATHVSIPLEPGDKNGDHDDP